MFNKLLSMLQQTLLEFRLPHSRHRKELGSCSSHQDSYVHGLVRLAWRRERFARPMSSSPWAVLHALPASTKRARSQGLTVTLGLEAIPTDLCGTLAERLRLSTFREV